MTSFATYFVHDCCRNASTMNCNRFAINRANICANLINNFKTYILYLKIIVCDSTWKKIASSVVKYQLISQQISFFKHSVENLPNVHLH